jgi:N-acetyl-gamma-glutamyl-phosphate reductase
VAHAAAKKKVFIDGEAGTTGLQVRDRLAKRSDIEILSLTGDDRKDAKKRAAFLNAADAAILCLPDEAAVEAVSLVTNDSTVIIDASTAHRVMEGWTYGFPELNAAQKKAVSNSKRIANPGCYPTGMIALTRPLVDAGILPKGAALVVHAVSGFSGGGKQLMAIHHAGDAEPYGAYGFNLQHKHLPEMAQYSGVGRKPIFCPAVGSFEQGMIVSVPLHYDQLADGATGEKIHAAIRERYVGSRFVSVRPLNATNDLERGAFLRPDALNDTNDLELSVYANDADGAAWLVARLDNLWKGA